MNRIDDSEEGIRGRLYRHLGKVFTPHGFKWRAHEQPEWSALIRTTGDVTQRVGIILNRLRQHEFDWSLLFSFWSGSAEAIFDRCFPLDPDRRGLGSTCVFNLKDVLDRNGGEAIPLTARAIRDSVAAIAPRLRAEVLPVLDAHQDLAGLDRLMNGPSRDRLSSRGGEYRRMLAIIVAYLARNPELPRLIADYRRRLRGSGDDMRELYERIAEYLTKRA